MNLVVCDVPVSMNKDGLYSLNDFHKAAGGESKNRPGYWLDTATAKKMIQLLEVKDGKPALKTSKGGSNPGTYACKELVYAYAMWIGMPSLENTSQTLCGRPAWGFSANFLSGLFDRNPLIAI